MNDLKLIKKHYGEDMMHFCRLKFPSLLETEGLLYSTFTSVFAPNKYLYDDMIKYNDEANVTMLVMNEMIKSSKDFTIKENTDPFKLFDEVGYTLYECMDNDQINCFRKYYTGREQLCTFGTNRLDNYHIFFAVKKNVDNIKRSDNPNRQDEYGTSVISIQFDRKTNLLSIKNRYNDSVKNPDNTFMNNLDNINPGLTNAFNKRYNLEIVSGISDLNMPNYTKDKDGKYYRYNMKVNNKYYTCNNLVIDNKKVIHNHYNTKEKLIQADYFLIDIENKNISLLDSYIKDSFINQFKDKDGNSNIKSIRFIPSLDKKSKMFFIKLNNDNNIYLEVSNDGNIIGYKNDNIEVLDENFLYKNKMLEYIDTKNVLEIKDRVLEDNRKLVRYNFDKCETIRSNVLTYLYLLSKLDLPEVKSIGSNSFACSNNLIEINAPKCEILGDNVFIHGLENCKKINMINLKKCGGHGFEGARIIKEFSFPNLISCDYNFGLNAVNVENINFSSLKKAGAKFMYNNIHAKKLIFNKLKRLETGFMHKNEGGEIIEIPEVVDIEKDSLSNNRKCKILIANNCELIEEGFMEKNDSLEIFKAENLNYIEERSFQNNKVMKVFYAPNLIHLGDNILSNKDYIEILYIPNIKKCKQKVL